MPAPESVGELEAESASIAFQPVLLMDAGGSVAVMAIEEIMNAGGEFQVLTRVWLKSMRLTTPEPAAFVPGKVAPVVVV